MKRLLVIALFALTPIALVAHYGFGLDGTGAFIISAAALIPLAWLIGEATEDVSEHTGPGIGGFVNASFGNAPELIIALLAVHSGLPEVVRGSITGSVVSAALLVLGAAVIAGKDGPVDRRSLLLQIGMVIGAVALFLIPSVPAWHGDPERHSLFLVSIPIAVVLLIAYLVLTIRNLRRHSASHSKEAAAGTPSLTRSMIVLGIATVATAFVSEILVGSLTAFGDALGLSEFFVAVVIVALVGNAAEHGGAIVVALKGHTNLAAEISVSSPAQVALFVTSAVVLLSGLVGKGLPLTFRPVELAAMALSAVAVILVVRDGRTRRPEGYALIGGYILAAVAFWIAGDRMS